jgi:hypothetical protein
LDSEHGKAILIGEISKQSFVQFLETLLEPSLKKKFKKNLGQGPGLVERNDIQLPAHIHPRRANAKDAPRPEPVDGECDAHGHGGGQRRRDDDGDEIKGAQNNELGADAQVQEVVQCQGEPDQR